MIQFTINDIGGHFQLELSAKLGHGSNAIRLSLHYMNSLY